jgi:hypothetical protein
LRKSDIWVNVLKKLFILAIGPFVAIGLHEWTLLFPPINQNQGMENIRLGLYKNNNNNTNFASYRKIYLCIGPVIVLCSEAGA